MWLQKEEGGVRAILSKANLSGANLGKVNLRGAALIHTILFGADLHEADLSEADLTWATLSEANLRSANLSKVHLNDGMMVSTDLRETRLDHAELIMATLRDVDLSGAVLNETKLMAAQLIRVVANETMFERAWFGNTVIADCDMSGAIGLDNVFHTGPSSIGVDTIYKSLGRIPESFLRGAGIPESLVSYIGSLVGQPLEFFSCFMSYSDGDIEFVERLYTDLKAKEVRCWLFREDAKWGEKVWGEIDRSIKLYDKLVVVCSENSLKSVPVIREIERALQKEDREKRNVLFPIRIDDYLFDEWKHERKADVVSKVVGDFRGWKDHDKYSYAFGKLLSALNKPQES